MRLLVATYPYLHRKHSAAMTIYRWPMSIVPRNLNTNTHCRFILTFLEEIKNIINQYRKKKT
jgi:hypothetical protein